MFDCRWSSIFGRTGDFAFQKLDIDPDIICMAKGMGNGFPVGGILIKDNIKAKFGMLGTTFGKSLGLYSCFICT